MNRFYTVAKQMHAQRKSNNNYNNQQDSVIVLCAHAERLINLEQGSQIYLLQAHWRDRPRAIVFSAPAEHDDDLHCTQVEVDKPERSRRRSSL